MCGNNCFGNNNLWIIIILVLLLCNCGGGCGGNDRCDNSCGCC